MRFLIVFGTTEGHTREICEFAGRTLEDAGHTATVEEAGAEQRETGLAAFDGVVLAASLHVGRYQPALVRFARTHADELRHAPNAFLSVSLSAAGENPDDWEGLGQCLEKFEHETGWTPRRVLQVAGAIRYSQYDFFKRLAIEHIAAKRGRETVTSRDYDLTDYEALRSFLLDFAKAASREGHAR